MLLLDLFEARDPKKSYELVEVKGKLDKIIVKLTGTESARYTKMAKRYTEINSELKKLQEERDKMNDDIKKDILENYFDAEDAVATRIIETISLTAQLAKTSTPSPKIDNDKVLDALLELMPDLKDKVKELQKQFTSIPSPKTPALSVKVSEGAVSDAWADFKKKATALLKSITSWGKTYDKKLAKIKEMMKPVRQVAEATIASYDEVHRQRLRNSQLMKAKTIIKNLNDSTMSQEDVKAIIKAMHGVDGDVLLSAEDLKKYAVKAKVDVDDVMASAGIVEE